MGIDFKHATGIDNEVFLFGNRLRCECFSLGARLQLLLYEHVVLEAVEFGYAVLRFNRRISGCGTGERFAFHKGIIVEIDDRHVFDDDKIFAVGRFCGARCGSRLRGGSDFFTLHGSGGFVVQTEMLGERRERGSGLFFLAGFGLLLHLLENEIGEVGVVSDRFRLFSLGVCRFCRLFGSCRRCLGHFDRCLGGFLLLSGDYARFFLGHLLFQGFSGFYLGLCGSSALAFRSFDHCFFLPDERFCCGRGFHACFLRNLAFGGAFIACAVEAFAVAGLRGGVDMVVRCRNDAASFGSSPHSPGRHFGLSI